MKNFLIIINTLDYQREIKQNKFFKPNINISDNLAIVGSSASILKKENGKILTLTMT